MLALSSSPCGVGFALALGRSGEGKGLQLLCGFRVPPFDPIDGACVNTAPVLRLPPLVNTLGVGVFSKLPLSEKTIMGAVSTEDYLDHYKARIDFRGDTIRCHHRHGFLPDAWLCGDAMLKSLIKFLSERE